MAAAARAVAVTPPRPSLRSSGHVAATRNRLPTPAGITLAMARPQATIPPVQSRKLKVSSTETTGACNAKESVSRLSALSGQPLGAATLGLSVLALGLMACPSASAAISDLGSAFSFTIPGVVGDDPVTEGFVSGFLLILFSEIGDKTFFIAMLLALQQSKTEVFTGTFGALAIMTVISVGLGQVLHQVDELLPAGVTNLPLDDIFAVILLVIFGIQTLQAAGDAEETAAEEQEEAQDAVDTFDKAGGASWGFILSTFALVFAAEWGDKSFIATIALAAASSPAGVVGGAVAGHGVATAIAVSFGSVLSNYVSERTVQYVGGSLFLVFAAATLVDIFAQV